MDFPTHASKPMVSWLFLTLPQKPLQPCSTVRILQTGSAHKSLHLCSSPIPKDICWVLPRTFLLCFGPRDASSFQQLSQHQWRESCGKSCYFPLLIGPPNSATGSLGAPFTWFAWGGYPQGKPLLCLLMQQFSTSTLSSIPFIHRLVLRDVAL